MKGPDTYFGPRILTLVPFTYPQLRQGRGRWFAPSPISKGT